MNNQHSDPREDYCQTFDLTCQIPLAVINANLTSGRLHLVQDIYQTDNDPCDAVYKRIEGVLGAAAQRCGFVSFSFLQNADVL